IADENANVDFEDYLPSQHFDSEQFEKSIDQIRTEELLLLEALSQENMPQDDYLIHAARRTLGRALHIVQDFYSHTNWIELGQNEVLSALVDPHPALPADVALALNSDVTCSDDVNLNVHKLTSGYYEERIHYVTGIDITLPGYPSNPRKCIHG